MTSRCSRGGPYFPGRRRTATVVALLVAFPSVCLVAAAAVAQPTPAAKRPGPQSPQATTRKATTQQAEETAHRDEPRGAPGGDTTRPAPNGQKPTREQRVQQLLDYLELEYGKKTTNPYWVTRAMGVISLARSPRPSATAQLLDLVEKDKHDVVRLLAWQAVLARAGNLDAPLDAKAFARFYNATLAMADRGMFHGRMRVPLVQVMAVHPPSARARRIWHQLFTDASTWEPEDIPVLNALGDCLKRWHSPSLVSSLMSLLTNRDHGVRADYVLQRAGAAAPSAHSRMPAEVYNPRAPGRAHPDSVSFWTGVQAGYQAWFAKEKDSWKEPAEPRQAAAAVSGAARTGGGAGASDAAGAEPGDAPWRELQPLYVAPPFALDKVDPDDKFWYKDLELGQADLAQVELVFVVDATESMGDVLEWLRHDVARTATALQMLCKEPAAIGVTFYRDHGDPWVVRHMGLTTRLRDLEPGLREITADGGGDIPEAVLDGLKDAVFNNNWAKRTRAGSKVLVLIGDAPPHEQDQAGCVALATKAAEAGLRIHAIKVTTDTGNNDLSSFDQIAAAGGGTTVAVEFHRPLRLRYVGPNGKEVPIKTIERPEVQLAVAPPRPDQTPGEKILVRVVSDVINPQYRDRVEPLASTLLSYCQQKSEPEQRRGFPANTPTLEKGEYRPQGTPAATPAAPRGGRSGGPAR